MKPAPPVGFNLTYVCPDGMVFAHDWFATPFVMMTCLVILFNNATVCNWAWVIICSFRKMEYSMHQSGTSMNVFFVSSTIEMFCVVY